MKFENIKVGDIVALRDFSGLKKCLVTKVTKKILEVDASLSKYSRKTGNEVGNYGLYSSSWVDPWTHKHDEELRKEEEWKTKRALVKKIDNYDWRSLTIDELEKVVSTLKEIGIDVEG
jgi:hypothetical protein